ncbi:hypothetical protein RchiOBHm_Chr3g0479241 [Rosa chinensis]|uniref:Uncharacterized protein n=2 Tax=Rosa chinensis TaxID=74649 RepID=A0A2P6RDE0_ROSCH|nr:uncharacterized protein LOC112193900 isoform X1 [Rosa chinensis]PRQ44434.1 hypothetical protein RchiOBHm_Chr3g0479241 [Rosa chinensis]
MPGLAHRDDQFSDGASPIYTLSSPNGFWSKHRDDVSYNQLQKFWSELSPQARQKLLRIDKHTLFEQARKNMYCSRCNGLLLEGFLQIVMYGKSLKQEGAGGQLSCNRSKVSKSQKDGTSITNGCHDEIPDPSVHPWGGLTITREGSLTLMDCYLYCKSLKGLQNVFDSARARERERELLYPDACGGGGRGWISQGMASYGRGHGTRETCALHTARLSCDTLVDFWSALGEETRQSLLRMKEEDFIERLMYRFDSKRFCRDCRRNVIREFKELKELKRLRKEPRCTNWFCVADTTFQYEVSDGMVQADWRHTFADTVGTYHHFEWAVGTGEGKSDILEFENVGMNGSVKVNGLDLGGLSACFITLRAWKLDGRCTELSVKAHALKGQQCVHCRLIVGDGYVTITRGESIRRFFEHAEEAEEEEDDDSMDKDGNDLDGECSRPQKHAKSPELAREFLLDAATVIFKEQVEKAFREGTARQNAHSIFVCLALKLLEERVHVACKDIITLEKQMKLLEEEEKEKREEEERKERRRTKEREKKLRRKERMKGKEKDKDQKGSEEYEMPVYPVSSKEESSLIVDEDPNSTISCMDSVSEAGESVLSRPGSPEIPDVQFQNGFIISKFDDPCFESPDGEITNGKGGTDSFTVEQSKFSRRRLKFRREVQQDTSLKWSDRRRYAAVSDAAPVVNRSESRCSGDSFETPARGINGSNRQLRVNGPKLNGRHCGPKFTDKFPCSSNRLSDRYDFNSCSCNKSTEYRAKVEPHVFPARVCWETKTASKSESALDMSKQFYRGNRYNQMDMRDSCARPKSKVNSGDNPSRDLLHPKKIWEPMEAQKKYPRSNSDSDVTLSSSAFKAEEPTSKIVKSSGDLCRGEVGADTGEIYEDNNSKESSMCSVEMDVSCQNGLCTRAPDSCNSMQGSYEENGISDPIVNSTSNSDNCSSCLSEGDSNTTSSNHGNQESSSTSDSEDASQQSGGKETSVCIPNGFTECNEVGIENNPNVKRRELTESRELTGLPPNGGTNPLTNVQSFDNGISAASLGSQQQSMLPTMQNQNVHFPVFQAPSTMGYYHQSPVSWPPAPTNGLLPFTHPNHYLYASPLGYGINGNSGFCMQYSPMQQLPTPLFTPTAVPMYQPLINTEEQSQISKSGVQESPNEANTESLDGTGHHSMQAASSGEGAHDDNSGKLHMDNGGFSLFHFGGPVALSSGCNSNSMPSQEEIVRDFPIKCSDHIENDHACNKEATMEEYNLFAASNGMRFTFF